MKLTHALIFFVTVLVVIFSVFLFISDHVVPKETATYKYDFFVSEDGSAGFNADSDGILHFGRIAAGTSNSQRTIVVKNPNDYYKKVKMYIANEEDIIDWFLVEPNHNFIIENNETIEFTIFITPEEGSEPRKHEGYVIVETYKAWPWEEHDYVPFEFEGKAKVFTSNFWWLAVNYGKNYCS